MGVQLIPATGTVIEVNLSGVWREVIGASGFSTTGGEADETDVRTFRGAGKITGVPSAPSSSVPIAGHQPHTDVAEALYDGKDTGRIFAVRVRTSENVIIDQGVAADLAGIAVDGVVTFQGADQTGGNRDDHDSYGPGIVIEIGGVNYIVTGIAPAGVMTSTPFPANAVAAALYKLKIPALVRPFQATVRSLNDALEEGSALSATLEFLRYCWYP